MTCCHGVTGAGRTMFYPLSICVTQPTRGAVHTMTPTVCRRGHKRLIGTVAASTPNDRRVIPDLTPSGASVLVVSFLHGIFPRRTGHGRRRTTSILHPNLWRFRGIVQGPLRGLRRSLGRVRRDQGDCRTLRGFHL